MKPIAYITRQVDATAIDLLANVCNVIPGRSGSGNPYGDLAHGNDAHAWLLATPERIDDATLRNCRRLRVIACAFRIPEHIDISACTRHGIWLTTVCTNRLGAEAELEAARNILDVMAGDTPRGALNEVLEPAA